MIFSKPLSTPCCSAYHGGAVGAIIAAPLLALEIQLYLKGKKRGSNDRSHRATVVCGAAGRAQRLRKDHRYHVAERGEPVLSEPEPQSGGGVPVSSCSLSDAGIFRSVPAVSARRLDRVRVVPPGVVQRRVPR